MILIVEDEVKLAELLGDYLRQSNMESHAIHHGDEVMPWIQHSKPELVLLDLMLPGKDGLALCREIRAISGVPIIITTAKVEEIDRLLGLELGADDYICKPYSPREVVARVKAVRRRMQLRSPEDDSATGERGVTLIDSRLAIRVDSHTIEFTSVEYQLVRQLVGSSGQIFSREQLMQNMYSDNRVVSDRTIDSHIKKIRKKLCDICGEQNWIQSVYGAGYRFER